MNPSEILVEKFCLMRKFISCSGETVWLTPLFKQNGYGTDIGVKSKNGKGLGIIYLYKGEKGFLFFFWMKGDKLQRHIHWPSTWKHNLKKLDCPLFMYLPLLDVNLAPIVTMPAFLRDLHACSWIHRAQEAEDNKPGTAATVACSGIGSYKTLVPCWNKLGQQQSSLTT